MYVDNPLKTKESTPGELLILALLPLLLWFLPNMIYFEKRRRYFSGPAFPARFGATEEADTSLDEKEDQSKPE